MSDRSKGRGRPMPDAGGLVQHLHDIKRAVLLEEKFNPNLALMCADQQPGDVSMQARDGAVHTMRYLKVWFDLPDDVYFMAINFLDRFLSRMKVKEKFLACLSISCLYLSASIEKIDVDPQKLVTISQSKCTVKDLQRMCNIIKKKLGMENNERPITALDYLNMYMKVVDTLAVEKLQMKPQYSTLHKRELLVKRLGIVMASSVCASYRPTTVALSLLQTDIELTYSTRIPSNDNELLRLLSCILQLQHMSKILPVDLYSCYKKIIYALEEYDDHRKICHGQKLEWRFSTCTMNASKPTDHFISSLSPVKESESHAN